MMRHYTRILFTLAVIVFPQIACANTDLTAAIDRIIKRPSQKKVQFGISIIDAASGGTLYQHDSHIPRVPASTMKLVTTAAALKYLGADYKYQTNIGLDGQNLVIIGSGDPLMGDKQTDARYDRGPNWLLDDITAALKKKCITRIQNIIIDTSIFDDNRVHPNWSKDELNRWYACQVAGLNYNGNCIDVTTKTTSRKVAITIDPKTSYVTVFNKAAPTSKKRSTIWCARKLGTNNITIRGKCYKKAGPIRVAIERPPAFFAHVLTENLAKVGITANGRFIEQQVPAEHRLKTIRQYSTPLVDVLARCNKGSFGLAAEALVKTIAADANPHRKNGGWEKGCEKISKYLRSLGIDRNEFFIDDGSGLSKQNKLSTNAVTKVLRNIYKSKNRQVYKDSLAIGGVDGTLRKHFQEKKYKGKILGKTGYIEGTKALSGFCTAGRGDVIFSILANKANGKSRTAINDIAKAIIDQMPEK